MPHAFTAEFASLLDRANTISAELAKHTAKLADAASASFGTNAPEQHQAQVIHLAALDIQQDISAYLNTALLTEHHDL